MFEHCKCILKKGKNQCSFSYMIVNGPNLKRKSDNNNQKNKKACLSKGKKNNKVEFQDNIMLKDEIENK